MSKMSKEHLIGQLSISPGSVVFKEKHESRVVFTRSRSGKLPDQDVWSEQGQSPEATRHYKISNQSKFLIQGPQIPQHSFLMEKVIDSRTLPDGSVEYLIKWKGQKLHLCQWLKQIDQDLIARYEADLRSGKTQSGKGTYSYKRALRREAKAMELSGQEPTQKLRNPRLHQNRSIDLHRHTNKFPQLEPLDPIACAASVRKRHSKIANGSEPGAEQSGSSSFDDSHFFSPRPMYWQPKQFLQPPRFYPQPNQNFEAKVFKPVRPVLQKSRTLPSFHFQSMQSSNSTNFIMPVPIYPSSSVTNSTDEKGAFCRADQPDRIESHFCDSEGRKFIKVGWKPRMNKQSGELIQPSPTIYAFENFPEAGYKMLIDYLVGKVDFKERGCSRSDNADGRSQSQEKKYQDKEEGDELMPIKEFEIESSQKKEEELKEVEENKEIKEKFE